MRNSSLVERRSADNYRDCKHTTEIADSALQLSGRGAFYGRRRCDVSHAGARRRANVGISSENESENLSRRKSKVS